VLREARGHVMSGKTATGFVTGLEGWIYQARGNQHRIMYPATPILRSQFYRIFAAIFPARAITYPVDSAADLAERCLLDPALGEAGIRHDLFTDLPLITGDVLVEVEVMPWDRL
jgi:hypothetical protein